MTLLGLTVWDSDPSTRWAFLHHEDGTRRTTAPTALGRHLDRFERAQARYRAERGRARASHAAGRSNESDFHA